MQPTNLSEYYQSIGERLPSVQERASIASEAGIQDYRGTATQNRQLLSYLNTPTSSSDIDLSQVQQVTLPSSIPTYEVPQVTAPIIETPQPTGEINRDTLQTDRQALQNEITQLEQNIRNRSALREQEYQDSGLYEDIEALNEAKARLRAAQDETEEIPIEARQRLRGTGATLTEFGQATAPELERNALRTLAVSRQTQALQDTVTANRERIDNYFKEKNAVDEVIYTQKVARLNQIEDLYSNIMSEEQSTALGIAKAQAEQTKLISEAENENKQFYLDYLIEQGENVNPNMSVQELANKYQEVRLEEEAARGNTLNSLIEENLSDLEYLISDENSSALKLNVGPSGFSRSRWGEIVGYVPNASTWRAKAKKVVASETFGQLSQILESGSLGALSEGELRLIQEAATSLGALENGKFDITEKEFKNQIQTMINAQKKLFIREQLGENAYAAAGLKDITDPDRIENIYQVQQQTFKEESARRQELIKQLRITPEQADQIISQNLQVGQSNTLAGKVADAIMTVESGGRQVQGASGEFGAFQFLPATWETISRQVTGQVIPQTPENERAVAEQKIGQLLAQGNTPREVALIWNTSLGGSEKPLIRKGVNSMGVPYDSEAYANKVESTLNQFI